MPSRRLRPLSTLLFLAPVVIACSSAVEEQADHAPDGEPTGAVEEAQCAGSSGHGVTAGCGPCAIDLESTTGCSETCFACNGATTTHACNVPASGGVCVPKPPPGEVAIATPTVRAPQLAVPNGDVVQLYGNLNLPHLVVYVGNQQAKVADAQITHTANGVSFNVPRSATSGPVFVTQDSTLVASPVQMPSTTNLTVDSYRNTDFYRFFNYEVTGTDDITFDDFRAAFGDADTTFDPFDPCTWFGATCVPVGPKIPRPEAFFMYEAAVAATKGDNHCSGMAITAARFLRGKDALSAYPSVTGGSGVFGLAGGSPPGGGMGQEYDGPIKLSALDHHLGGWHLAQFSAEYINGMRSSYEAERLGTTAKTIVDQMLAGGDVPFIVLTGNGKHGHVVTAYATEAGGTMDCWGSGTPDDPRNLAPAAFRLHVADPGVPVAVGTYQNPYQYANNDLVSREENPSVAAQSFDGASHSKNLRASTIAVDANGNWCHQGGYGSGTWTGGLGSLMPVSGKAFLGAHATLPNSLTGIIEILTGDSSIGNVFDASSHALLTTAGALNTDAATRIPSSVPIPIGTDLTANTSQAFAIGGTGPYVHTITGVGAGSYMATFVGGGLATQLSGVTTSAGATDTVTIDHASGRVAFRAGTANGSLTAQVAARTTTGSDRMVTIHSAPTSTAADASLVFSADRASFTYTHAGAAGTVAIDLDDRTPNTAITHATTSLALAPGDVVKMTPSDWSHLDTAPVTITTTHANGTTTGHIQIDARGLSLPGFLVYDVSTPFLDTNTVQSLDLAPGQYFFQWYSGALSPFSFTVSADGTVSYDASCNLFLGGAGTSTLVVKGFSVTLDATRTDNSGLLMLTFNDMGVLDMTKPEKLTLPPSAGYGFLSGSADLVDFAFSVDLTGQAHVDPIYGGFASASASTDGTTVTFTGYPVTVHMNQSGTEWTMLNFGLQSRMFATNQDVALHLLPTGYSFLLGSSEVANAGFAVARDGAIVTDASHTYETVSGRTVTLNGYQVTIDATAEGSGIFEVFSLFGLPAFDVASPQTLHLLPTGWYEFMGAGKTVGFVVQDDGSLTSDPSVAGVTVQGGTLVVTP